MIIGTRGSDLARTQTGMTAEKISKKLRIEIKEVVIETQGDVITDRPLRELEGRGYFTKEIEEALLGRRIDIAVHSFKDMPSQAPDGLALAAVSEREDPADLLIINKDAFDPKAGEIPVKEKTVVGTSAVRREMQVRAKRSDLIIRDLRGNVPTRIKKLAENQYDAIFLASAGVRRLKIDLSGFQVVRLEPTGFIPSPGQGALAIQMREDDYRLESIREIIHDQNTGIAADIERDVMARFGGGCSLPLGVYAFIDGNNWHVYGFWGENADRPVWSHVEGKVPSALGEKLYLELSKGI